MIDSPKNRETQRKGIRRARAATIAGVAAMSVGLAAAPAAQAYDTTVNRNFTWDPVYSSGLVAGLIDFVSKVMPGVNAQLSDTISFHTGPPPSLGLTVATSQTIDAGVTTINAAINVGLDLVLRNIAGDTKNLYNTEAGIPQPGCNQPYGLSLKGPKGYASTCRYAMQLATLGSVDNLINAYRAQIASVQGDTPAGFIPFTSGPNATPTFSGNTPGANGPAYTNQALIFLQNNLRPNGGLSARFPKISSALGIDPSMPAGGTTVSPNGKIALNTTTLDLTWAYDPIGDFPAVFDLPAIANSILGALPLNIVTGGLAANPLQGSSLDDIGLNLAGLLQLPIDFSATITITASLYTLPMENGQSFYSTLVPNELPITAAMGLPGTLVNFALNAVHSKFLLGNPLGDALAPAMKILVNTGYTDVIAPDKLNTCATGCGTGSAQTWAQLGYQAYDRTFGAYAAPGSVMSASTPTPFNSVQPLTPAEKAQEVKDVAAALIAGFKAQLAKPLWGIIVPNTGSSSAASTKSANAVAAKTTAPVAAAPAAAPAVEASTPVAATVADPTPALTSSAPAASASLHADRGRPSRAVAAAASTPTPGSADPSSKSSTPKPAASTAKSPVTR